MDQTRARSARLSLSILLLLLCIASDLLAQDRKVDPTWLHRSVPRLSEAKSDLTSATCHYKPIFGEGDSESRTLRSTTRFGEATLEAHGSCQSVLYDREEEIYFVFEGTGILHYGDETHPVRANDFTYLAPGVRHSIANNSGASLRILVMGFKIPSRISLAAQSPQLKIIDLDNVREQPVDGHPTSVLYKLMVGARGATRDAIDDAYVVTSLFWMDFGSGGTNFPHHHETEEEIYLVLDGQGDMVAGSGMDGIEGRFPSQPGDAYYFRPNCTVGFYNQNKSGAKAYILAVRSRIPLPEDAN
jgi:mannose-6-phosphate isomerase-like protein (cupin superfamily)